MNEPISEKSARQGYPAVGTVQSAAPARYICKRPISLSTEQTYKQPAKSPAELSNEPFLQLAGNRAKTTGMNLCPESGPTLPVENWNARQEPVIPSAPDPAAKTANEAAGTGSAGSGTAGIETVRAETARPEAPRAETARPESPRAARDETVRV